MTAPPPALDPRSRPGKAAGIGSVALAMIAAIAVAGLFLVLIGADRAERVAAPEPYRAPRALSTPSNPGNPVLVPVRPSSALPQHDARTDFMSRSRGVLSDTNNTAKGEQKQ